ncbi:MULTISPECIES: ATP-binding protein [unclassified Lentimicrobium]|uniref:sensor histidine kinase n=1 Tax=unclassified Lentimicrobium TaxID=2677434 RepID=UPI0015543781|nr:MULTISPECIES: ATP-binding protein [unclassified Lentimicrobium]NPD44502.1 HAMP domain-containing protein [Lentimicrobium sp. S6]NPD84198.1 HAMP domain-containing protein [Lentimicrobium sp. L6]
MKMILKKYMLLINISLLLLVTVAYVILGNNKSESITNVAQQIQSQVQSDQVLLDGILLELQEVLILNGKEAFEIKALSYQAKYKNRFAFALYEDQQLELWTENHIVFSESFNEIDKPGLQHLGSYQVVLRYKQVQQFSIVGVQIIKIQYPWENEYLMSHLASYFSISKKLIVSDTKGFLVEGNKGEELFYIDSAENNSLGKLKLLPFFLFIFSFYFLAQILQKLLKKLSKEKELIALSIFSLVIFTWYGIHLFFGVPEFIFQSELFSPGLYAHFWIYNTIGNLFFISLMLMVVVIYYFNHVKTRQLNVLFIHIYLVFIFLLYYILVILIRSLIFDSQIGLDLFQLASLNIYSYLVILIIFILQFSLFFAVYRWLGHFINCKKVEYHIWIFLLGIGVLPLVTSSDFLISFWLIHLSISAIIILTFYWQRRNTGNRKLGEVLFFLVFFTFLTTFYLNYLNDQKEGLIRETSALTLDLENDPFLEEQFISSIEKIQNDEFLIELTKGQQIIDNDDSLLNFISEKYFESFMQLYHINLIHCDEESMIMIMPDNFETSCYQYFSERIKNSKSIIREDTLYLIQSSFQYRNYIGRVPYQLDSVHKSCIFIEFVSKVKPKEMGLPAILEKSHIYQSTLLRNYSYAVYGDGDLTDVYGKFDYKQKLEDYRLTSYHDTYFDKNNYQHYIYSKNKENVLIISLEKPGWLQRLASFAFIFLFYSLFTFLLYFLFNTASLQNSVSSFQGRLQYSMIILLLFSFILIGVSSLYYIIYLNQAKNADSLMEKAHSVLIELEHKLSGMEEFTSADHQYVESLLMKFAEVFFTDITLYNKKGELLASSRPEMFSAALLSNRMEANAYYELKFLKNSFFIQEEKIGSQNYLSAYLPFRNQDNHSVAYLNLPYFAKQYELEEEVSGFIVAFLNIYLFLLFITVVITLVVSRYLSKPLQMIKEKMGKLDLQDTNEKIEWNKDDEIGELVKEYNRMVEELSLSAQKLAITQRESAWREMAQQIAHEIKNPLTPMKLNVQYLERAWDDQVEDFEVRMKRITKGLQEQIDVLSEIAGQFSTFAAIDKIQAQQLDIKSIIIDVESIFKGNDHVAFSHEFMEEDILVSADKNQLIRVFNNLYKNAVQAIGQNSSGAIHTKLTRVSESLEIRISDDGCGIADSELTHIFEPRFTTKTSGMGLGLALVKKMIENIGGTIRVETILKKGTSFIIKIPIV